MTAKRERELKEGPLKWWFYLTEIERWLVLGILAIALTGLTARTLHLRSQQADPLETQQGL
jgi:hypothetical protein